MSVEYREHLARQIVKHRRLLNRLDPHLPCITCRRPLTNGRCLVCDPKDPAEVAARWNVLMKRVHAGEITLEEAQEIARADPDV